MKKIIAAVVAIVCVLAILVVCAIVFKPEEAEKPDTETTETSAATFIETEPETWEPGYVEEETWVGPEIDIE